MANAAAKITTMWSWNSGNSCKPMRGGSTTCTQRAVTDFKSYRRRVDATVLATPTVTTVIFCSPCWTASIARARTSRTRLLVSSRAFKGSNEDWQTC